MNEHDTINRLGFCSLIHNNQRDLENNIFLMGEAGRLPDLGSTDHFCLYYIKFPEINFEYKNVYYFLFSFVILFNFVQIFA